MIDVAFREMFLVYRHHGLNYFVPRKFLQVIVNHLVRARLKISGKLVLILLILLVDHLMHRLHHGINHLRHHFPRLRNFEVSLDILLGGR